jgi:DNA recombination protein RmuC
MYSLIGLTAVIVAAITFAVTRTYLKSSSFPPPNNDLQKELQDLQIHCAKLEERASRIAELEAEVSRYREELKTEAAKNASLAEQAARIPGLEMSLASSQAREAEASSEKTTLRERLATAEARAFNGEDRSNRLEGELKAVNKTRDELAEENAELKTKYAETKVLADSERSHSEEKLALLESAKEQLSNQFKLLANEIFEVNSSKFAEQNKTSIDVILEPLKTKLQDFQAKVEEVYVSEGNARFALSEQVKQLLTLNKKLSEDAEGLTRALKGSTKTQGNWGEMILEKILEFSGLRKGIEYVAQKSYKHGETEDGSGKPDVIINLPDNRHIIIDAKVSLTAHDEFVNADSDANRQIALDKHIDSIRNHIKDLSGSEYHTLIGINTLDFVIMFVPIESAFITAITYDIKLWEDAWKKNIILVSPSTLLFALRTIKQVWRQEDQSRNAKDIADRGALLLTKFVSFVADLQEVGDKLEQARSSYDGAWGKLKSGRGNLVRQSEILRELGVKSAKELPAALVDESGEDTEALASGAATGS